MIQHSAVRKIRSIEKSNDLIGKQTEIIHNYEIENVRNIVQGKTPHRKHKRLKLGGGHLYDRSNV
jgi:hypothetical protein